MFAVTAAVQAVTSGVVTFTVFGVAPMTPGTSSVADVPSSKIEAPVFERKRTMTGANGGPKFAPLITIGVAIAPGTGPCTPTITGAWNCTKLGSVWSQDEPNGEITRIAAPRNGTPQTAASGVVRVSVWAGPAPLMSAGMSLTCCVPAPNNGTSLSAMKRTMASVPWGPKFVPKTCQPSCWTAAGIGLLETPVMTGATKSTKPGSVGSVQQPSGKNSWTLAPIESGPQT